jgi:arylsulfatase A-like enzyme
MEPKMPDDTQDRDLCQTSSCETEDGVLSRRNILLGSSALVAAATLTSGVLAQAQKAAPATPAASSGRKPNILMIMADDIGWFNVSAYNLGVMGYRTPNIDRIAKEGALFTDWYGEQSCTAGRAAFITGQSPIRTGLTKVGLPGSAIGLHAEDMSVAEALKPLGYATGQFGKNHLGDRNEYLPTVHGFDEFFGNLYHLNAEEEPQNPDYPKDPRFRARFGPRGVLKCKASDTDDPTVDPSYGRVGKQVIENTGPLDTKRIQTVDEEFIGAAIDFIDRKQKANTPWFCYFNPTRMHVWTHLKPASDGQTKLGIYPDGMVELDGLVGQLLKKLDDLGIADNTIVVFTTDNGAEVMSWPNGGATPFRGEKATNWEGGYRVPMVIRWPGAIKPGTVSNEIMSHNDWIPTLCAIAGEPAIVDKLKAGYTANGINYKVHLDGYDQSQFLRNVSGSAANNNGTKSGRDKFFYSDDDGLLVGFRNGDYKYVFSEQRMQGTMGLWAEPFTTLRLQKIFNLMQDPFERADITSNTFWDWQLNHVGAVYGAMDEVFQFVATFKDFPPRSFPPSFNPANIMESTMDTIKQKKALTEGLDLDRIRGNLNRMIEQQLQQRGVK